MFTFTMPAEVNIFNLDEPNEDAKHELERYFAKLNKSVKFADDNMTFTIEEGKNIG